MAKRSLLLAIGALLLAGNATGAQQAPTAQAADGGQVCVSVRHIRETMTIGTGADRVELSLGGGACEPPGSGLSDLWAEAPERDELDALIAGHCPALRLQIAALWSERSRQPSPVAVGRPVWAGPYLIAGRSDLFDLKSAKGRTAAARWITRTLTMVRPCWNNSRQDRTRRVTPQLYRLLR